MATPFSEIYEIASRKITDPELSQLPEEDLEDMFHGWLISAISQFRKCKNDLSDRDEETKQFNVDLLDVEKEILAILVCRAWLSPMLRSTLLINQVFSDKEQKWYSQSQHIAELRALDSELKIEAQKLSRDYTYNNSTYWEGS